MLSLALLFLLCSFSCALPHLHIGLFDWDDNIVRTNAKIYLERLQFGSWVPFSVSTKHFAELQQQSNYSIAYRPSTTRDWLGDFSDQQGDNTFLEQAIQASVNLSANAGGALSLMKFHIMNGYPVSIVTARSHAPRNILRGFEFFLSSQASVFTPSEIAIIRDSWVGTTFPTVFKYSNYYQQYWSNVDNLVKHIASSGEFVTASNPIWNLQHGACAISDCKAIALQEIVRNQIHLNNPQVYSPPVVISFSDDDSNNVRAVTNAMLKFIRPEYPTACLRVYNTSDPENPIILNLTPQCDNIDGNFDLPASIPRLNHHFTESSVYGRNTKESIV